MKRILVIRHGETTSSRLGHFTGRADVALTESGRRMAEAWRAPLERFSAEPVATFSSPLVRCVDTAAAATGRTAEVWDDLVEWDLGVLDGVGADAYRREHPEWNLFLDGPPAASGEAPVDVQERARRVVDRLSADPGDSILFTHGQFSKALIAAMLDLPPAAASRLALGPAKAALLLDRAQGLSLAGWNLPPTAERLWMGIT